MNSSEEFIEIKMPFIYADMEEATVQEWLAKEGEYIDEGDFLFVAVTDKSVIEVEASTSGYFYPEVTEGSTVAPQQLIGKIYTQKKID